MDRVFQEKLELQRDKSDIQHRKNYLSVKKAAKAYLLRLKLKVIEKYGGKCACCGITNHIFLTVHHIEGRIRKDEHWKKICSNTWRNALKEDRTDLKILCHNCHFAISHYSNQICPCKNS